MKRSYQFRIYPTKLQITALIHLLDLTRNLYNVALEQRIFAYKNRGKSLSFYDQDREIKTLRKVIPEYVGIDFQLLECTLKRLDRAFQAFFRRVKSGQTPGFPRFKGRDRFHTLEFRTTGWKYNEEHRRLKIRGVGSIKVKPWREIPEGVDIKCVRITRKADGWYATFVCDGVSINRLPKTGRAIGIDLGIKNLVAISDGTVLGDIKPLRTAERKLRKIQRIVSRRKKGSHRRRKAVQILRRRHLDLQRSRKSQLDVISRKLINENDVIAIEDLNIQGMVHGNRWLNREIHSADWSLLTFMLVYKAEEAGRRVIKVNPRGTSQECFRCGQVVKKSLGVRIHRCPYCGLVLDRDHNAAINVLNRGLQLLRGGDQLSSVKRENHVKSAPLAA